MKTSRRAFTLGALSVAAGIPRPSVASEAAVIPYATSGTLEKLPFGTHSHWLQPWRDLIRTRTAADVLNGIGINWQSYTESFDPACLALLAQSGFRHIRIELGWSTLDYETQSKVRDAPGAAELLRLVRLHGLRPLILLNANDGFPCPAVEFSAIVAAAAHAGDRTLVLDATDGFVAGRTGISGLNVPAGRTPGRTTMCQIFFTQIRGNTVALSQPLFCDIPVGTTVKLATLRYEPFSVPGSAANDTTLAGWVHYVKTMARFVAGVLGTEGQADLGFDMEIWNELSFGSWFTIRNAYYDPPVDVYPHGSDAIWAAIVDATAAAASADPRAFSRVAVVNGFSNTVPWPASSQQPDRVSALCKHPYPNLLKFPADEQHGVALDATGEPTKFVPTYTSYFPEYYGTAIQTETICRDAAMKPNPLGGVLHGQTIRQKDGGTRIVQLWTTEIGMNPAVPGVADLEAFKARAYLRALLFYLCIGVERVYLFAALDDPDGLGVLDRRHANAPTLQSLAIKRTVDVIRNRGSAYGGPVRPLHLAFQPGEGDVIVRGGQTEGLPDIMASDALVLLPIMVKANRFLVAYWTMTRDARQALPEQDVTVAIAPLASGTRATVYDPVYDRDVSITSHRDDGRIHRLGLRATDTPRLLILTEPA